MVDIPLKYFRLTHLREPNDKTTITWSPLMLMCPWWYTWLLIPGNMATTFYPRHSKLSGRRLYRAGCHLRTDFPVYERKYPSRDLWTESRATKLACASCGKPLIWLIGTSVCCASLQIRLLTQGVGLSTFGIKSLSSNSWSFACGTLRGGWITGSTVSSSSMWYSPSLQPDPVNTSVNSSTIACFVSGA